MLAGDAIAAAIHDPEECEECLLQREIKGCRDRCGNCCQTLLIEATELDARREPKIREHGPMYRDQPLYLLNSQEGPCVFLRRDRDGIGVCSIYDTRPLVCRLFRCDSSRPTAAIAPPTLT